MKQLRAADYLQHMQEAAQLACGYVEGMDKQGFLTDRRTQQAVIMNLIILGEAATKLLQTSHDFLRLHPEVEWKVIRNMRNRMAHGYFSIDLDIVWETVKLDLPKLLSVLPHIIADAIAISGEVADE